MADGHEDAQGGRGTGCRPYDGSIISADSHVIEPPSLWTDRLPGWGDRAPTVVRGDDGNDWWWVDGHRTNSFAGGTQAGRRFAGRVLVLADRAEHVPGDVWDPHRYAAANLDDGIVGSVLFPTQHLVHFKVRNTALVDACTRAYNDWLAEFCAAEPERLRGVAALNVDDVPTAVAELRRAAGRGLVGALVPVGLPRHRSYAEPVFDDLWAAAADLDMPVCLHIGSERADPARVGAPVLSGTTGRAPTAPVLTRFAIADLTVRQSLGDLIFGGVLERHPGLRVGSVEHEAGWAPHFVDRLDFTYTQRATKGLRFADGRLPSDFVAGQVFVTWSEDALAVRERARLGPGTLLWASDFPHSEGTFPHSRRIVGELTAGVERSERHDLVAANAARLFRLPVPLPLPLRLP
jgi:predicted TIM-barrel fold metal-dependent hydrolase